MQVTFHEKLDSAGSSPVLSLHQARLMANILDSHHPELANTVNGTFRGIDDNTMVHVITAKVKEAGREVGSFMVEKSSEIARFAKANPEKFAVITSLAVLALASGPFLAAVLSAVGFTTTGVAGGSLAAAWQSAIGNVAAGSFFAFLQSITATGTAVFIGTGIGVSITALAALALRFKEGAQKILDGIKHVGDSIGHVPSGGNRLNVPGVQNFNRWVRW